MEVKQLAALVIGCISCVSICAQEIPKPRVIDGDTVDTGIVVYQGLKPLHLRIHGIDTPEIHGKCDKEKQLAQDAKKFLSYTLANSEFVYRFDSWDKYGGRVLGDILIQEVPVSQEMIRRGYAIAYSGEKKVKDWCK
jgi:endonuclease YncB( thermonuclease family)